MKNRNRLITLVVALLFALPFAGCYGPWPVDEDGLLITDRKECAVLKFDVLDTRDISALADSLAVIDTVAQTIKAKVKWKAGLDNLWPVFTLSTDCKLTPKVTSRRDFSEPVQYTVISGNRKIRKTYTITLTVAEP